MASKYKRIPRFVGVFAYDSQDKKFKGKADRCFYIRYQDAYNKQVWEKVGWQSEGYTAQFASNVRNERIRSARHGALPEAQRNILFREVWEKYDKWLTHGRKRPYNDRQRYHNHLKEYLENVPLAALSPAKLEEVKEFLFRKGLAPATVKHCLVIVRHAINQAISWGMWSGDNPVTKIKLPQVQNKRERFLTYAEAQRLIAELGKRSVIAQRMAIVSLETGLRAGEIRSMRWQDIDFNARTINVRGKGGYDRQVHLTEAVQSVLENQPRGQSGYVFESRHGTKVREISRTFHWTVQDIGLNDGVTDRKQIVSFHTLRHTFASWLALEGTPILTIKELMGHKSIEMTMRYAHLCPDHKREAVVRISGRWSSAGNGQGNPQDP
jgi:integrase